MKIRYKYVDLMTVLFRSGIHGLRLDYRLKFLVLVVRFRSCLHHWYRPMCNLYVMSLSSIPVSTFSCVEIIQLHYN